MRTSRFLRLAIALLLDISTSLARPQQPFDLDPAFRTQIETVYVTSVAPFADGSVLLSGQIQFPDEGITRGSAKVLSDGNRDPTFPTFPQTIGGGKITSWADRYYIGVSQTVRRLDMNGHVDPSFISMNLGPYFESLQGGDYHVFPDGRVLMSGAHTLDDPTRGFVGLYNLIWFSNEGYLDTTRTHRYCDEVLFAIEEQPDGKFLCSGTMHSYEDQPVRCIFRVHDDGELDTNFQAGLQWGEAIAFSTLPDGRILAGGSFKQIGSEDTLSLVRLMPDGSMDPSFELLNFRKSYRPDALYLVSGIMPISDGRIIVTGGFNRINGEVRGCVAMLDENGALINDAFTGNGCDTILTENGITQSVRGIIPSPDGSYYIYGGYHGYDDGTINDTEQRMVSRLYGFDVGVRERQEKPRISVFPNPCTSSFELRGRMRTSNSSLILLDATGRVVRTWPTHPGQQTFSTSGIAPGNYIVRYSSDATYRSASLLIVP